MNSLPDADRPFLNEKGVVITRTALITELGRFEFASLNNIQIVKVTPTLLLAAPDPEALDLSKPLFAVMVTVGGQRSCAYYTQDEVWLARFQDAMDQAVAATPHARRAI